MENPLLSQSKHLHGAVPFDVINEEHYLPALKQAIESANSGLEVYKSKTDVNFEEVIEKLDQLSEDVDYVAGIFYSLYSAHATDKLREVGSEFNRLITQYSNAITLDEKVFNRIAALYNEKEKHSLTHEQLRILEKYYSDFERNGACLPEDKKEELKKINEELSDLSMKFSDNILEHNNELYLHITNKDELVGIPESVVGMASAKAKEKKLEGWAITLDMPIMFPVMKFAENRHLRRDLYRLSGRKASEGKFDNTNNINREVSLRVQRSQMLGYKNHADYVLEKRMAQSPEKVMSFLKELFERSKPKAQIEMQKLQDLARELDGIEDFDHWDTSYYSEKLKMRELNFNDEVLKPYFPLNKVYEGIFIVAEKLYNLKFNKIDIPVYHPDVDAYEVMDGDSGEFVGLFYFDLFPRNSKKQGAWMGSILDQGLFKGKVRRPHVYVVCNFTKAHDDEPSLLTFGEVLTFFHEFGHALHGLLSKCHYRNLSGTNVYWDFVELPSQIMENWIKEKECLDLFAEHYKTGEKIPSEILNKIQQSNQFLEAMSTLRQVSLAMIDMGWHTLTEVPKQMIEVDKFEKNLIKDCDLLPGKPGNTISFVFGHLFAGGYSAGYYSYKWAEVLDADAFEYFKEKGIFNPEVSHKFRTEILEKGGTEDPMVLYKNFRGHEPDIEPLMKRAGLI